MKKINLNIIQFLLILYLCIGGGEASFKILKRITKSLHNQSIEAISDNLENSNKHNLDCHIVKNDCLTKYTSQNKEQLRIICLGDSITWGQAGYEPSISKNPWPTVLSIELNSEVQNVSFPGSTLAKRNESDYDCFIEMIKTINFSGFDRCYIAYGTNDLSYKIPIGSINSKSVFEFYGAMNKGIEYIKDINPSIDIIFIIPMLDSRFDYTYCNAIADYCNAKGFYAIDLRNIGVDKDDLYSIYWDKKTLMHPNEIMYKLIGKYIALWPKEEDYKCYKIIYDSVGGYMDLSCSFGISGKTVGELPLTVKSGHDFEGWYYTRENVEYKLNESSVIYCDDELNVFAKYKKR